MVKIWLSLIVIGICTHKSLFNVDRNKLKIPISLVNNLGFII